MSKIIETDEALCKRALNVLSEVTKSWPLKGQYETLETITGVGQRKWRMLKNGVTSPTTETLCALAKMKPQFAAYLLLGNEWPDQEKLSTTVNAVAYIDADGSEVLLADLLRKMKEKSSN